MRLIDADTLRAEFTDNGIIPYHHTAIWAMIDLAPTVDPVRHGHWTVRKLTDSYGWEMEYLNCSVCDGESDLCKYDYCPNCGAKMDEVSG